MKDISERLRTVGEDYDFHGNALIFEAADEIDRLRAQLAEGPARESGNHRNPGGPAMTTNKPEVVAWLHSTRQDSDVITDKVRDAWGTPLGHMGQYAVPLVRLSDYKALQAECEKLVEALEQGIKAALAAHRKGGEA